MNTYLIVSETIYHVNECLKKLTNNIDNIVTFNMDENTIDEILSEASYYSMFDDQKCIIVKNAKIFSSGKSSDSKKAKEDSDKLIKYLSNENKNTKLIFICNKVDSKKKIYTILKENNNIYSYPSMTKTEMKNELNKIVINNKYKIDDNSLWYIINASLGNFDICINELNKIFIYYSNSCYIKYEDVINLVSVSIEDNNFKLVDSIINRDLDNSLKYIKDLKILKVEPNIILSLLYREFKLMLYVSTYEKNRVNYKEILSDLKIQEWQYNKIKSNMRLYSTKEIKEEIINLSKIDYKLKSGLIDKSVVLIDYVIELCS